MTVGTYQLRVRRITKEGQTEEGTFALLPKESEGTTEPMTAEMLMAMEAQTNTGFGVPVAEGRGPVRVWIWVEKA